MSGYVIRSPNGKEVWTQSGFMSRDNPVDGRIVTDDRFAMTFNTEGDAKSALSFFRLNDKGCEVAHKEVKQTAADGGVAQLTTEELFGGRHV